MTMGPEPMMRIEWMSVRLGIVGRNVAARSGEEKSEVGMMNAEVRGNLSQPPAFRPRIEGRWFFARRKNPGAKPGGCQRIGSPPRAEEKRSRKSN